MHTEKSRNIKIKFFKYVIRMFMCDFCFFYILVTTVFFSDDQEDDFPGRVNMMSFLSLKTFLIVGILGLVSRFAKSNISLCIAHLYLGR